MCRAKSLVCELEYSLIPCNICVGIKWCFAWNVVFVYNVTAYAVATSSVLHILYWVPLYGKQMQVLCVCIFSTFLQDVSPHGIWMLVDLKMLNIASGGGFLGMSVVSIIP